MWTASLEEKKKALLLIAIIDEETLIRSIYVWYTETYDAMRSRKV